MGQEVIKFNKKSGLSDIKVGGINAMKGRTKPNQVTNNRLSNNYLDLDNSKNININNQLSCGIQVTKIECQNEQEIG